MKTRSLKLPADLDRRLEEHARRRRLTRSAVVREAVEAYLVDDSTGQAGSVLARIHDLAGCVEGPPDLSTSEGYLDGYGHEQRGRTRR
jgi:predicted DNA-binding protein